MRSSWFALVLVACMPKVDRGPVPFEVLETPVHIVERPTAAATNVYFQAVLNAGSAYDPPGREGLAALTVRSMIDAGAGERTGQEVRELLFTMGTSFDLVVDREYASIRLQCHVDHAETCRDLFTDVLTLPRFRDTDVLRLGEQAKNAVTSGLLSDEEALGEEVFHGLLYEAHPYGHPIRGRAGVIDTLDAPSTKAFWRDHVRRSTVTVGIAGAYEPPLLEPLREALERLPGGKGPELLLPSPNHPRGRGLVAISTETGVTGFHLGHPIEVDRNHKDWPALTLAMTAFGAHRQSFGRLYQTIRQQRGLNYGDYAYAEPYVQRGWAAVPEQGVRRRDNHFYIWIRPTSVDNGAFALKLAIDELERLVDEGITEDEFENTRAYLSRRTRLEATDPGRALAYALDAVVSGTPDKIEFLPRSLESLTATQVNAAIQAHIHPSDLWIVAVSGSAEELARDLVEETPTPIVYADMTPSEAMKTRDTMIAEKVLGLDPARIHVRPADGVFR